MIEKRHNKENKMKAAIITLTSVNYGNRLQNYAVQKNLESIGVDVYTLHNPFNQKQSRLIKNIKNVIKRIVGTSLKKSEVLRQDRFKKFDRHYIQYSPYYLNKAKDRERIKEEYNIFIIGSDQVWNPMTDNYGANNFAFFVKDRKKIALAASFGVKEMPENKKSEYSNYLSRIDAISVREESGKKIVSNLLGIEPTVLIDPVMSLENEEWKKIEKKPEWMNEKTEFAFQYFLGKETSELKRIKNIIKSEEVRIVNIMDYGNRKQFATDPCEFLWLIRHSKVVLTDSFHASVFSFMFYKPLVIFDRVDDFEKMNTRLDNLMEKFELQNRHSLKLKNSHDVFVCNYLEGHKEMKEEKKKYFEYLYSQFEKEV